MYMGTCQRGRKQSARPRVFQGTKVRECLVFAFKPAFRHDGGRPLPPAPWSGPAGERAVNVVRRPAMDAT